jgi:hypothetical protein
MYRAGLSAREDTKKDRTKVSKTYRFAGLKQTGHTSKQDTQAGGAHWQAGHTGPGGTHRQAGHTGKQDIKAAGTKADWTLFEVAITSSQDTERLEDRTRLQVGIKSSQ